MKLAWRSSGQVRERGVRFRGGVIDEVGRIEFRNVRELQGALNRLIAYQTLGGEQIDSEAVISILGDLADQRARVDPPRANGEFANFLTDISIAVAHHVEQWKTRLTDAIAYWSSEGYRTGILERVLNDATPPSSVESVLREFEGTVGQLRDLEKQLLRLDTALAAHDAFRDPDRLSEAEQLLERALRTSSPPPDPRPRLRARDSRVDRATSSRCAPPTRSSRFPAPATTRCSCTGRAEWERRISSTRSENGLLDGAAGGGSVACVPAQLFVDELIAALQEGTVDRWRAR